MSEKKTARLVVDLYRDYSERCLWVTSKGAYIVTSSAPLIPETMAFYADEDGHILDFGELGVAGEDDHEGAIRDAGYEPEATDE